ncbi:hypothetical protein FA95DRAFT_1557153 [Auriscalpium vulgare]|uniref:Uncharacterized protein n=1 Tax=Auriscalpium vulgare TaxID=40419 RepID=A0ACB8S076_9AGAM|nr:hypothetical protein FA95DRAFT_1557153 [Auriscalpium vulgare]
MSSGRSSPTPGSPRSASPGIPTGAHLFHSPHELNRALSASAAGREWAVLVPAWSTVVGLLTYFTYYALAFYATPPFDDMSTISDSRALVPDGDWAATARATALPQPYDIPIGLVNRVLYDAPRESRAAGPAG